MGLNPRETHHHLHFLIAFAESRARLVMGIVALHPSCGLLRIDEVCLGLWLRRSSGRGDGPPSTPSGKKPHRPICDPVDNFSLMRKKLLARRFIGIPSKML